MKRLILTAALLSIGSFGAVSASAAEAAKQGTNTQQACPAGQKADNNGACSAEMPATPHQQQVLKSGKVKQPDAATGAATGMTTGQPTSTETPHQQQVLKSKKSS